MDILMEVAKKKVKTCKGVKAQAWKAFLEARVRAEKAYEEAIAQAEKAYRDATSAAWEAYNKASIQAWKALDHCPKCGAEVSDDQGKIC